MAKTIRPYDQAQNNYASGIARTNAENTKKVAAGVGVGTHVCVKVVPVDIWGRVLEDATVTLNGTAGKVADVANAIYVAPFAAAVTCKVELDGYETVEMTIPVANVDVHKEVTIRESFEKPQTLRKKSPFVYKVPMPETYAAYGAESGQTDGGIPNAYNYPFTIQVKVDDAELSEGQENKEFTVKITGTCPLSESGKKRFPGCTDLADALKSQLENGVLTLKSTTVVPGEEIRMKSPFRVSDVATPEILYYKDVTTDVETSSEAGYTPDAGLYVIPARTLLYFRFTDSLATVYPGDTYLCKLGSCDGSYTTVVPVIDGGDATIKQSVNFVIGLKK